MWRSRNFNLERHCCERRRKLRPLSPFCGERDRVRGTVAPCGTMKRTGIASARRLRRRMTDAEMRMWFLLRDRRLAEHKFRRQVPIGPWIADFVCTQARLVVEIDGGQHADSQRDTARDHDLESRGYRVVEVLEQRRAGEYRRRSLAFTWRLARQGHLSPSPCPSPQWGEGTLWQKQEFQQTHDDNETRLNPPRAWRLRGRPP